VVSQYCDGSRIPPEFGGTGYQVPPGIADATVPNPIFSLTPAATVDEGNNWVNISWGPLAETNPVTGVTLGNYAPAAATSPVVGYITAANSSATYAAAPALDFFGRARKTDLAVDVGAVEFNAAAAPPTATFGPTPGPCCGTGSPANSLNLGSWVPGNPSLAMQYTYTNTGPNAITATTVTLTAGTGFAITLNGCTAHVLPTGNSCAIAVQFTPASVGTFNATLTVNGTVPLSINLTGTGIAPTATMVGTLPQPFPANFGSVPEGGAQSVQQIYTYTNTSTGNFTITGFTLSDATDFTEVFTSCTNLKVLAPNGSCTVQVQFNPHSVGVINSILTVTGPAARSVTLTGTGTYVASAVTFSAPNPALTTATADLTTKRGVVTVTNTGPGRVSMTAVPTVIRSAGTGAFSLYTPATGTPCTATTVLAFGASCVVGVQYVPVDTATATAHVSVTDTGTGALVTTVATQNSANFNAN
jgi:hypothetical protein